MKKILILFFPNSQLENATVERNFFIKKTQYKNKH